MFPLFSWHYWCLTIMKVILCPLLTCHQNIWKVRRGKSTIKRPIMSQSGKSILLLPQFKQICFLLSCRLPSFKVPLLLLWSRNGAVGSQGMTLFCKAGLEKSCTISRKWVPHNLFLVEKNYKFSLPSSAFPPWAPANLVAHSRLDLVDLVDIPSAFD